MKFKIWPFKRENKPEHPVQDPLSQLKAGMEQAMGKPQSPQDIDRTIISTMAQSQSPPPPSDEPKGKRKHEEEFVDPRVEQLIDALKDLGVKSPKLDFIRKMVSLNPNYFFQNPATLYTALASIVGGQIAQNIAQFFFPGQMFSPIPYQGFPVQGFTMDPSGKVQPVNLWMPYVPPYYPHPSSYKDFLRDMYEIKRLEKLLDDTEKKSDGENIAMVPVPDPKTGEFKQVPVRTSGAFMFELMFPLMMASIFGRDQTQGNLVESSAKLIDAISKLLPKQETDVTKFLDQIDKIHKMRAEYESKLNEERLKRIEDKIETTKTEAGSFFDFLKKLKEHSDILGIGFPLLGSIKDQLELEKFKIDHADKYADILKKLVEIQQGLSMGDSVRQIMAQALQSFLTPMGQGIGEGLKHRIINLVQSGSQQLAQTIARDLGVQQVSQQISPPLDPEIQQGMNLTQSALQVLARKGAKAELAQIRDYLDNLIRGS